MNIFTKIKNFNYRRRYRKFKNCNIPYPFYDNKRNTLEWVTYYKDFNISSNLLNALGNNTNSSVTYHYSAKLLRSENNEEELTYHLMISHSHNFDEVIKNLYDYPETFEIPNEFLNEYSEQELTCLKQIKNYLLLIGLKDYRKSLEKEMLEKKLDEISKKNHHNLKEKIFIINYQKNWEKIDKKEKFKRYENSRAQEFSSYYKIHFNDNKITDAIIDGKKDYMIYFQHTFSSSKLNEKYLVMNNDYNYIGIIEIVSEEIIKIKDLQENMVNYKLFGFKEFKKYKQYLINEFKKESKLYNEVFTEDSLIKYVKIKVIKKF